MDESRIIELLLFVKKKKPYCRRREIDETGFTDDEVAECSQRGYFWVDVVRAIDSNFFERVFRVDRSGILYLAQQNNKATKMSISGNNNNINTGAVSGNNNEINTRNKPTTEWINWFIITGTIATILGTYYAYLTLIK